MSTCQSCDCGRQGRNCPLRPPRELMAHERFCFVLLAGVWLGFLIASIIERGMP